MKVAYFSPLPPSTSGIADYSALLLPALERLVDVEVVRPGRTRPLAGADVALYHIGNDPDAHGWIVDALRRRPGLVVLHDFVVHHLVAGITSGRNDGHAYLAAMERDAGPAGRMLGWGVLEGRVPPLWEVRPTEFPLVGCFGYLNANQRIPQLLEAFALLRRRRPGARLLLVGAAGERFDLERRLERLGLGGEAIVREDYVPEERLWSLMAACDVLVNLRSPTMGETSGAVIRGLALGKPMLVSDVGWFAELPDGAALRIPVDEYEVPPIAGALELAAGHAAELGEAARAYVRREHDLGRTADGYAAALAEAAGGEAVADAVLRRIAVAALEVGVDDPVAIAREARRAGIV